MECSAWVKADRPLRRRWLARKRAERKPGRVQALAASPPYFKGLGSLFRSLVSAFQVGYYDRHCTEENPEARQVRTHTHTEQSWDPNPRSVLPQSPLQRAAFPTPWIPKGEPSHTVQPASVREGWGRVLKAEHPNLAPPLPPLSRSNSIHPQKHAPPHNPIPAHQPHH